MKVRPMRDDRLVQETSEVKVYTHLTLFSTCKAHILFRFKLLSPKVRAIAERRGSSMVYFKSTTEDKMSDYEVIDQSDITNGVYVIDVSSKIVVTMVLIFCTTRISGRGLPAQRARAWPSRPPSQR